jgi:hypothetical protein
VTLLSEVADSANPAARRLPRLLYVGDVPVEDSIASGTLLFRLLEEYPPSSLCIVETNLMSRTGRQRLPNVIHKTRSIASKRLLQTRFHSPAMAWEWIAAPYYARRLRSLIDDFAPEAVVTTVPFSSWAIASRYARICSLPLHILLWDDILGSPMVPRFLQGAYERSFFSAYRQAKSRFCISPEIERFYADASGASGTVVHPFGGPELPRYLEPPIQDSKRERRFTFAFAGSLFLGGYRRALEQLARACKSIHCNLIVIGSFGAEDSYKADLADLGVRIEPYKPISTLVDFLREHADSLALIGSFDPTEQRYCSLLFPSRLVAYSATALPCFGYGSATFTGTNWLVQNVGKDTVCNLESHEELVQSLKDFVAARDKHQDWGKAIANAGARDFDFRKARDIYFKTFASN